MAETQATLKRIGLTPGKAILIGILGIVLAGIVYKQFGSSAADDAVMPAPEVNTAPIPVQRATPAAATAAVVGAESDSETQVELLELDQARWKSPELSAVIAYDPFALPASFPQSPKIGIAAELADGEVGTSAAVDAEQLAEALERLRMQLDELKTRGVHVIVNKNDQYVAMIGDRMIHVGDEINGFIVTEIDLEGVRVERKEGAMKKSSHIVEQLSSAEAEPRAALGGIRLRIADCGLRIRIPNPQSAIRNPQLRWGRLCISAILLLFLIETDAFAQASRLVEIIQEAASSMGTVSKPVDEELQEVATDMVEPPDQASEDLPPPTVEGRLPLASSGSGQVELSNKDGRITLIVRDAPLSKVLALLAQAHDLNVVAANDIDALISITLRDVPLEEALNAILSVANYTWVKRDNIILITSLADSGNLPAEVQGRQIQIFDLDFASATVVAEAVSNFLSPIGKVTISQSSSTDNRLTQERVVIEDLPDSLARIAEFISQIDQPPRQVLIEAHVLQVNLDETTRCGVNLDALVRLSNSNLDIQTAGFANPNAPQAFLATLEGGDLGGVIEALQTTTDTKTLGSPKLLVLNEQEARIQVGEQLGFKVTTTTETSTLETVQFLDVGVILNIIPRITRDGRVLLHVKPEVSKGEVNPETGLPEEESTELETDVMLEDGQGMIIGGLIQEIDSTTQSKVPYLGNVKGVGWLFRKSEVTKTRVEIIVALVPRIQPYSSEWQQFEQGELVRAEVPLLHGPLCRTDRPWDPVLPDGKRVYKPLIPKFHKRRPRGHYHNLGQRYVVPPRPLPEQNFYDESCDSPEMPYSAPNMRGPAMPDEAFPAADGSGWSMEGAEVITDQE